MLEKIEKVETMLDKYKNMEDDASWRLTDRGFNRPYGNNTGFFLDKPNFPSCYVELFSTKLSSIMLDIQKNVSSINIEYLLSWMVREDVLTFVGEDSNEGWSILYQYRYFHDLFDLTEVWNLLYQYRYFHGLFDSDEILSFVCNAGIFLLTSSEREISRKLEEFYTDGGIHWRHKYDVLNTDSVRETFIKLTSKLLSGMMSFDNGEIDSTQLSRKYGVEYFPGRGGRNIDPLKHFEENIVKSIDMFRRSSRDDCLAMADEWLKEAASFKCIDICRIFKDLSLSEKFMPFVNKKAKLKNQQR